MRVGGVLEVGGTSRMKISAVVCGEKKKFDKFNRKSSDSQSPFRSTVLTLIPVKRSLTTRCTL